MYGTQLTPLLPALAVMLTLLAPGLSATVGISQIVLPEQVPATTAPKCSEKQLSVVFTGSPRKPPCVSRVAIARESKTHQDT